MTRFLLFFYIAFIGQACVSRQENKLEAAKEALIETERESSQSRIDTAAFMERVKQELLRRLEGQQVRKPKTDENGDITLRFFEDTVGVEPSEIIWEFYQIKKESMVSGDLNGDATIDFAFQSMWSTSAGNIFGLEWHVFVSNGEIWSCLYNDFGGGKFSDMETIVGMEGQKLITRFQEWDEETGWLNDSFELRKYSLKGGDLIREP